MFFSFVFSQIIARLSHHLNHPNHVFAVTLFFATLCVSLHVDEVCVFVYVCVCMAAMSVEGHTVRSLVVGSCTTSVAACCLQVKGHVFLCDARLVLFFQGKKKKNGDKQSLAVFVFLVGFSRVQKA